MKKVLELIEAALKALTASKSSGLRAESIEAHLKACASNAAAELKDAEASAKPDANDDRTSRGITPLAVAAMVMFLAMMCLTAQADTSYQSFGATNFIAGSSTITSFPTNSPGTNGLNQLTGGKVDVYNNERASFVFRSEPIASNATNNITFSLIRAYRKSPLISSNSVAGNGSFAAFVDWETLPTLVFAVPQNGTNATTWSTNLDSYIQGGCVGLGIYSIQNGSSAALTNYDAGLSKKLIPIVYP